MSLGFLAHADVADCRRHQNSFCAFQRTAHDLDGELAALLPPVNEFNSSADLLRQRFCGASGAVRDQPLRKTLGNDVLQLLPYQLVAAISELFFRLNIQQNDLSRGVHHYHRIRSRFQQSAVSALHLCQMSFRFLAHADVADCRRDQNSFCAFQRTAHDLDGELAALLPPVNEFNSSADLLRQRFCGASGAVRDQPLRKTLGNDVLHLLPYQFVAAISELLFHLNIQQNNLSRGVHHYHRIRSRFQQSAVSALHLCQMSFRFLAHADVADCRRDQNSFCAFQRTQHDLDGELAAIFPPCNEFNSSADLLRQRFCGASGAVRDQPLRKTLGNDVLHLLPYQLVAAISKLFFRLNIQQNDLSRGVYHYHRIRSRFQQSAVSALHLCQMSFGFLAHADVADCRRDQNSFCAFQRTQHDLDGELAAIFPPCN